VAAADKGQRVGQAIAITTLTPVRHRRRLAFHLWLVRHAPRFGRPLEQLAFIYFARWTIIDRLPPAQKLRTPYLLFESNFDGSWGEYLDAFADRLAKRITRLWGTCYGYERHVLQRKRGHRFPPGDFKRFVQRNELRVLRFHAAYPDATTVIVRQAIALGERNEIDEVASSLALGPAPVARPRRGRDRVEPLTLALPLAHDPPVEHVDLATVPGTHFARFVRIGPELIDLGQPREVLDHPYLLFTSNHDGTRDEYLRALATAADAVWRACAGYPGRPDPEWLAAHALETDYFVIGYPPRTVGEIRELLAKRTRTAHAIAEGMA
jgi:hypothetical protein